MERLGTSTTAKNTARTCSAIMDRQAISVRYQKAGDDEPEWRTVSPQTIVNAEKPYAG